MVFWITAAALAIFVAVILAMTLLRAKRDDEHPAAYDLRVYRDQLTEVDRDLARGVLSEADAERIRAEVGRRVLAADAQLQKAQAGADQPRGATYALIGIIAVALVGGTLAIYPQLGAPGMRDLPRATRIEASEELRTTRATQADFVAQLPAAPTGPAPSAEFADLMAKLRETVAQRPDDLQGQMLLARNEAALGNYTAAWQAQEKVIALKGDTVTADDYVLQADLMITAAQGYVSPEAETALRTALEKQPGNPIARYYLGHLARQVDRPDMAFRLWDALLKEGPETAPWVPAIRSQIEEIAWLAGIKNYTPPAALPGPSAEDMQNAAEMTPEERQDMIRGMVERLNDKLANEGGTPQEWARLIGALGVLGQTDRAQAIWDEAQRIFADKPQMLAIVRGGAVQAGLLQSPAPAAELPGPTAEDMQNAKEMSAEDRQEMIRGMVAQLSERLAADGGSAQEWARLITSQAILGDRDAAQAAYDAALAAHGEDTTARATLDAAAQRAGLTE